jgi:hypothetical protein
MTVFEYIEDFDNHQLPLLDWMDQMLEAVKDYNFERGTRHDPATIVAQYSSMVRQGIYGGRRRTKN